MIRGISKKIIEVNNTGSEFFEKAVFYVKNDRLEGERQLKAEADRVLCSYIKEYNHGYKKGYLRRKETKNKNLLLVTGLVIFAVIFAVTFVLLI